MAGTAWRSSATALTAPLIGTWCKETRSATDASGVLPLGNSLNGVLLRSDASATANSYGNQIGGSSAWLDGVPVAGPPPAGVGNIIAHNGGSGVAVTGAGMFGNPIRGNAIFANERPRHLPAIAPELGPHAPAGDLLPLGDHRLRGVADLCPSLTLQLDFLFRSTRPVPPTSRKGRVGTGLGRRHDQPVRLRVLRRDPAAHPEGLRGDHGHGHRLLVAPPRSLPRRRGVVVLMAIAGRLARPTIDEVIPGGGHRSGRPSPP